MEQSTPKPLPWNIHLINRLTPLSFRPSKASIFDGKRQKLPRPIRAEISPKILRTWERKQDCPTISANARMRIYCHTRNPVNLAEINAFSSFNLSRSLTISSKPLIFFRKALGRNCV